MEQVQRVFLYAALFVVAFFLWQSWNKYYTSLPKHSTLVTQQHSAAAAAPSVSSGTQAGATSKNNFTNVPALATPEKKVSKTYSKIPASRIIHVRTDVFDIGIDSKGGNIVSLKL